MTKVLTTGSVWTLWTLNEPFWEQNCHFAKTSLPAPCDQVTVVLSTEIGCLGCRDRERCDDSRNSTKKKTKTLDIVYNTYWSSLLNEMYTHMVYKLQNPRMKIISPHFFHIGKKSTSTSNIDLLFWGGSPTSWMTSAATILTSLYQTDRV